LFDALGARPFGIVAFAVSAALLVYLQVGVGAGIRADAVAIAPLVEHPSRIASFVTNVFVHAGERVSPGTPLVDLSPHFIDRELRQIDAEVEKLLEESKLAQARLLVDEQRWLSPEMRMRPDRPSLERPTDALYAKEIAVLQTRRAQLLEDRSALTVTANLPGRIVLIADLGSAIATGGSVASISPEFAKEIVAYVPSDLKPAAVAVGTPVNISRPARSCRDRAEVLRRGAMVEEAPGQLRGLFRFPVHGMPVYISIPDDCELGVGQVLSVEFARAVM
jgi:hypothetical protein